MLDRKRSGVQMLLAARSIFCIMYYIGVFSIWVPEDLVNGTRTGSAGGAVNYLHQPKTNYRNDDLE